MPDWLVRGPRVYLRAFTESDAEVIARDMTFDEETFFRRGRTPQSVRAFRAWIAGLSLDHAPAELDFAVCRLEDDHLIGLLNLEYIDWVHRTAESGSQIFHHQYRGQGYGTEAKHLLLQYAFDQLQLHAIRSFVFEDNTRSVAALLKQGYRPAGKLLRHRLKNRRYRGMLAFDCLREDWQQAYANWMKQVADEPES